jgi:CubicO group peptidase (beta-lactamase class C family)
MQSHRKFGVSAGKFGACLAAALLSCTSEDAAKPAENTGGAGGSGGAASYERAPFPAEEWTVRTPEEMGMDRQLLEQACAYALEFDGDADGVPDTFTQGVVIVRGNALVHECYASQGQYGTTAGGEPIPNRDRQASDLATSWSGAKSFTSTLIGIAIDEGLIEGVNVPMSTFFPEWAEDERREIRLQDVLWMQSGLRFREEYIDVNAEIVQLFNSSDANAFARALPAERPPGSNWYYSSGDTQLLGAVLQLVTGKTTEEYAREKIFQPIGMRSARWWKDGSGATATYCCIDATIRDFARFGLLALSEGHWDDSQPVSTEWMQEATGTLATRYPGYAYQWWTWGSISAGTQDGMALRLPYDDIYFADGLDMQKIFVIPSLDLVVAKNTLYTPPEGDGAQADPGSGVLTKLTPRGIGATGTVGPLVWDDAAFLAPIINAVEGSTKVEFTPTQLGARDPDPAECRRMVSDGAYGEFCEAVHGCTCDGCSVEFLDCDTSEACRAIINCALEVGCRGIACLTPCEEVINQYGGATTGNIAISMALNLSECTEVVHGCATSCE